MRDGLEKVLKCPNCEGSMVVFPAKVDRIYYKSESSEMYEIRDGTLHCLQCKARFWIRDYIPSFTSSSLVDHTVIEDGIYWGRYYLNLYNAHVMNFVDIREPFTPFYMYCVKHKSSWKERMELNDNFRLRDVRVLQNDEFYLLYQNKIVEDRLNKGSRVLEIGSGSGWLSLELKRKGYNVVGLDVAFEALRLAKRYAISKGYYIEYISCPPIPIFKANTFDGVFAFHSLHHVPNLYEVGEMVEEWLKDDGLLCFYDHSSRTPLDRLSTLASLSISLFFRCVRSRFDFELWRARSKGSSPNEDVGINAIHEFAKHFNNLYESCYLHCLDQLVYFVWYMTTNREITVAVAKIIDFFQKHLKSKCSNFVFYILENRKRAQREIEKHQN